MTRLEREVRRLVSQGATEYVVSLVPARHGLPAAVSVREKGRRTEYQVPVGNLYVHLVDAAVTARKDARRKGRTRLRRW